MLCQGTFKDNANRSDRHNPLKSFKLPITTLEDSPTPPPHWRRAFPI